MDALEARVAAGGRARLGAWAPPAAVAAVTLALGSFDLTRRSYWIDEAFNVLLVREPWSTYLRTIGAREPSQGVYLLFLKPYTALVGRSELATRLPSVLAAAAAAALLVDLGRRLFGTRVAVVAGVLLAVDGRFVEWSQYARTYSLAVLAAVATTTLFVRACGSGTRRAFLVYGLAGAVSVYCHFYAGFVLVGHAAAFPAHRPRLPVRRLAEAWAVIAVGLVPFAAYLVRGTRSPVEWIPPLSLHEVGSAIWFAAGANVGLLVAALAGVASLVAYARRPAFEGSLATAWAAAPIVCGVLVSVVKPALVPRFAIVASPAIALLAALALDRLARVSAALAAALGATVLVLALPALVHTYRQDPEDWRAAAQVARSAVRDGSTVAVLPDFGWRALAVYAPYVPRVESPSGRTMTLLVAASPSDRRPLVTSFIGRAPYRLLRIDRVGPDFVAERWAHR